MAYVMPVDRCFVRRCSFFLGLVGLGCLAAQKMPAQTVGPAPAPTAVIRRAPAAPVAADIAPLLAPPPATAASRAPDC